MYISPASAIKPVITNLSTWFSDVNCSNKLRSSIPVTSAPVAPPRISYFIGAIFPPIQRLWFVVAGPEILVKEGESGTITVLEIDPSPQPKDVAVITTVPDHPVVQDTNPVTESNVPADSLFHDQVTFELEVNCVVSPDPAGQFGKVKGL